VNKKKRKGKRREENQENFNWEIEAKIIKTD
jgi:hypothetical protein